MVTVKRTVIRAGKEAHATWRKANRAVAEREPSWPCLLRFQVKQSQTKACLSRLSSGLRSLYMSPSVEDSPTLSPSGTTEQNGQDQVKSNHHDPSSPTSPSIAEVRGKRKPPPRRGSIDKDAQELVISSLRDQVQDLVSQVTELNNKLVKSYDRVSDLEDGLHDTSSALRNSSVKISQLELERSQHLSALNTGLLVEKTHVTAELTRLMEKATEEAARRGQAESARADIEKDLDDVSAALFDQANTMVAEARWGRAQSERKAEEAERSLVEAEDAVRLMQQELQAFQEEKDEAERSMENMRAAMGKGKWVRQASLPVNAHNLLASHVSYQEFLALISHLRALRATSSQAPVLSSLLGLPFIARLQVEDTYVSICAAVFPFIDVSPETQRSVSTWPLLLIGFQGARSLPPSKVGN